MFSHRTLYYSNMYALLARLLLFTLFLNSLVDARLSPKAIRAIRHDILTQGGVSTLDPRQGPRRYL